MVRTVGYPGAGVFWQHGASHKMASTAAPTPKQIAAEMSRLGPRTELLACRAGLRHSDRDAITVPVMTGPGQWSALTASAATWAAIAEAAKQATA